MRTRLFVGVAGCCALLGCQQSLPDLSGTYTGTLTGNAGEAAITVRLVEMQQALSGDATGAGLGFMQRTYYVAGSHKDDGSVELDISLSPDQENSGIVFVGVCSYRLNGGGDAASLAGTYFTHSCDNGSTGMFSLKRE